MDEASAIISMGAAIATLCSALAKVTHMLLKEKDSKIEMLREFYEMTNGGSDD